jgi:hypothetical protein
MLDITFFGKVFPKIFISILTSFVIRIIKIHEKLFHGVGEDISEGIPLRGCPLGDHPLVDQNF